VSTDWKPVPKVVAAGLGGAVATLLVWLLSEFASRDMPAEAGAALAAVLAFAFGYLKSPVEQPTGDPGHIDVATALGGIVVIALGVMLGTLLLRLL
jgi:hypothetical protein